MATTTQDSDTSTGITVQASDRATRCRGARSITHGSAGPEKSSVPQSKSISGIRFESQVDVPATYKGVTLDRGYCVDLIVENEVVVELKTTRRPLGVHEAQLLTYLRLLELQVGLLINFNVEVLRRGIRRRVLSRPSRCAPLRLCASAVPHRTAVATGVFRGTDNLI